MFDLPADGVPHLELLASLSTNQVDAERLCRELGLQPQQFARAVDQLNRLVDVPVLDGLIWITKATWGRAQMIAERYWARVHERIGTPASAAA